jgi:hypothetical protein
VLEQLFLSGSSVAAVGRVEPPRAAKPRLAGVRPRAKRA